ncbi:unnamed protein product [Sphagnum tenellum]
MEEVQEPVSPQKRKRRPSVRLGEIGYSAPYLKASFVLEPAKRKKQQQVVESGVSPVRAPRTRLLDHVAVERKQQRDERWSPLEAADTRQQQSAGEEETKTEAVLASTKLYGDGGKVAADSRDPATTSAEEEQGDAHHPNSHGDEIQGAIEDGPMRNNRSGKQRTVAKQDLEQNLGTRQRGDSDTAGENGAHLLPAAKPTIRQCITLTSGVQGWLRLLDLARYAETFELHEVDNEVLPLLTMEDLREMGVNAVGARRKMFTAIQDLHHGYGT